MTCDFKQCGILTSVDSDQPVQPPVKLRNSKIIMKFGRIFKRLAKALIRLRVCAGSSEAWLVAHTTLLEISCHGSYISTVSEIRQRAISDTMLYNLKLGNYTCIHS